MAYISPTEASTRDFEPVEILHDGGEGEWAVARAATGVLGIRSAGTAPATNPSDSRHRAGMRCGSSSLIR